jgi:hypothetical protein
MIKIYAGIAAIVALGLAFAATYRIGYSHGAAGVRAEIAEQVQRRLKDAQIADDAATRCLADPQCRMSNDGYRRD